MAPLAVVLVAGAAAVVLTAAALSWRAARHPVLPSQRWSRPLPATVAGVLDARPTGRVLAVAGLAAVALLCATLARSGAPVDGLAALPALTVLTVLAGPVLRLLNPTRLVAPAAPVATTVGATVRHAPTPPPPAPVDAGPAHPHAHGHSDADPHPHGHSDADPHPRGDPDAAARPSDPDAAARPQPHGHAHIHGDPGAGAPIEPGDDTDPVLARDLRIAAAWLLALCTVALWTTDGRVLAAAAALHVVGQALLARRGHRASDPVDVLAAMVSRLAPAGRAPDGRLAWRNPMVAAAHTALPRETLPVGAIVIAASAVHAMGGAPAGDPAVAPLALTAIMPAASVAVTGMLRVGVIRPWVRSVIIPLVVAYGVMAAGRWWPPVDLVVFVALHVAAIAVLHRQAFARHDLRTARAVQFPMRFVVLTSVVLGLAVLAAP